MMKLADFLRLNVELTALPIVVLRQRVRRKRRKIVGQVVYVDHILRGSLWPYKTLMILMIPNRFKLRFY